MHLKRFVFTGVIGEKIDSMVDYPINGLQLKNFVTGNENERGKKYNLYATSNHLGTAAVRGHYIALCQHLTSKKWNRFNDTNVTEVNDLAEIRSNSAYLLFYAQVPL